MSTTTSAQQARPDNYRLFLPRARFGDRGTSAAAGEAGGGGRASAQAQPLALFPRLDRAELTEGSERGAEQPAVCWR